MHEIQSIFNFESKQIDNFINDKISDINYKIILSKNFRKNNSFVKKNKTKLFKSSQHPFIDIDEPIDLKIAKLFL